MVALLMTVLLLAAGVAIDVGNIYQERRRMQNAADAGALAGAWEICFGDPALAETTAESYALQNLAQQADVLIDGGIVVVTTTEQAELFIAGLIGMSQTTVNASAAASCAEATMACLMWPITFNREEWWGEYEGHCDEDGNGEHLLIWKDSDEMDCYDADTNPLGAYDCDLDDDGDIDVTPDERMWVDFSHVLLTDADDPCDESGCGANELEQRIHGIEKHTLLPCQSALELPSCTVVDSGVRASVWDAADDEAGRVVSIPLFDPAETPCEIEENDPGNACSSERAWITHFGCIRIVGSYRLFPIDGGGGPKPKVIEVEVVCDPELCSSECGTTVGVPPEPGGVRAVSLIR
jgi:hypothetical protein